MRPSRTVAGAALTAALVIGALPGLVGSHQPAPTHQVEAALFEQVTLATPPEQQGPGSFVLDDRASSAGALDADDGFAEAAGVGAPGLERRAVPDIGAAKSSWTWKPPRFSLTGTASFYDFGTTAMRDVPRGTTIVICGAGV